MDFYQGRIEGVIVFTPTVHRDGRGFFTRTFDSASARLAGIDPDEFVQDSQSRSARGVVRGMHLRSGAGEAKLVRCARGSMTDVLFDARPHSPSYQTVEVLPLDDAEHHTVYIPAGVAHGWQATSLEADVCYRIDAEHDPSEDVTFRFDDPEIGIEWPLDVSSISDRDAGAPAWAEIRGELERGMLRDPPTLN